MQKSEKYIVNLNKYLQYKNNHNTWRGSGSMSKGGPPECGVLEFGDKTEDLSPGHSISSERLLQRHINNLRPLFLEKDCCVADRVLVLWPGVRLVPLRWESRVQDIGPPETSRLHITSNDKSSPRDLHLNAKTQLHSMMSKLQGWTPYAKQLARQEHSPIH